ncbi:RDD family protein [Paeniglutamicibacter cryotolerans]|uniref:Putative RDD family membrane protein YckC n=1 Tax=Paeniglutamicibacter cryotolerans TaxID=670079 RepID=A0A839QRQ5_9MICC|nr:RDD family protein [Paeniglutamicibacter cryotolerans]MBB2996656.1 putative RDD family membrane protein YckC [Paeniglutamicibacter cryotolerans]
MERKDFGSWLEGPPQLSNQEWPGQRLGRPEAGPGSVARIGRRVVALCIDWAIAMILAALIFKSAQFADLAIFAVTQMLFVGVTGHSIGHRIMSLQVQGMDGKAITPLKGVVRTLLILLVIPVLISDADQRGYHDKIVNTVLVRI